MPTASVSARSNFECSGVSLAQSSFCDQCPRDRPGRFQRLDWIRERPVDHGRRGHHLHRRQCLAAHDHRGRAYRPLCAVLLRFRRSVTISTNGAVTGGSFGITGRNNGTGGALTVTANGDVTGSGTTSRGIFAVNVASGTNHNPSPLAQGPALPAGLYGIFARNYGTGATKRDGQRRRLGRGRDVAAGQPSLRAVPPSGTDVTVTTGAGTTVTGASVWHFRLERRHRHADRHDLGRRHRDIGIAASMPGIPAAARSPLPSTRGAR